MNLSGRFIKYDVETRWNSTYRMLEDRLKARAQIDQFVLLQTEILSFTDEDWRCLAQIHQILAKFNELILFVSEQRPQISFSVPIYYELHDLLYEDSESQEVFRELDLNIASTIKEGLRKYKKYYTFIDNSEVYYTALILDLQIKGDLILGELEDKKANSLILKDICDNLRQKYPPTRSKSQGSGISHQSTPDTKLSSVESRMLQRLQPRSLSIISDINKYLDTLYIDVTKISDPQWLCNWWRLHKDEFPQMAAAARDYLVIPALKVEVKRLFNIAKDILGVRRYSMNVDIMRILMLLDNSV